MNSTLLMLDALFPPSPTQLVADCREVGASGCFAYVARPGGIGTWTPDHVAALLADGSRSVPIIVPLPAGQPIGPLLGAVHGFGFTSGPVTLDLETPNLPPASWEEQFDAAILAAGYTDFDYGRPADLGLYQPDDANWKASWLRTGVLNPLPPLPSGWHGWQFVNDIVVNGTQYDASVIDEGVFSMTDDQIREAIYQWYWTILGRFPNDADKAAIEARWLAAYKASPLQARYDFGVQAQADVGAGKNLGLVRHFEQDAAIAAIPAGPQGPAGPAGPATYVRHEHKSTTDTGTPV